MPNLCRMIDKYPNITKWNIYGFIIFMFLIFFGLTSKSKGELRSTEGKKLDLKTIVHEEYCLGKAGGISDYASIEKKYSKDRLCFDIKIVFTTRRKNKTIKTKEMNLGTCTNGRFKANAVLILSDSTRKDLFVSMANRVISTYAFSYKNGSLITMYKREYSLVEVFLWPTGNGRFSLIERWPLNEFEERSPSGGATLVGDNSAIRRTLKPNKGHFVIEEGMKDREAANKFLISNRL